MIREKEEKREEKVREGVDEIGEGKEEVNGQKREEKVRELERGKGREELERVKGKKDGQKEKGRRGVKRRRVKSLMMMRERGKKGERGVEEIKRVK